MYNLYRSAFVTVALSCTVFELFIVLPCCEVTDGRILQVDEKRPLVYSALQLGRSWDDAICSLLGDVEVKPLTTPPPQFGLPVMVAA